MKDSGLIEIEEAPDVLYFQNSDSSIKSKDSRFFMEFPFFSLSKKPTMQISSYYHEGNLLTVIPSAKGMATIYDKEILIYCISHLMKLINDGEDIKTSRFRVNCHNFLKKTGRGTGGRSYEALADSLDRIAGTRIRTNISNDGEVQYDNFGILDSASFRRKEGIDGRILWCEVKFSDWLMNTVKEKNVLTLHKDYFKLKRPFHRRIYEIGRKHYGIKKEPFIIGLDKLLLKSGCFCSKELFKYKIKEIKDPILDYRVSFDDGEKNIIFENIKFGNIKKEQNKKAEVYKKPEETQKKPEELSDKKYMTKEEILGTIKDRYPPPQNNKEKSVLSCWNDERNYQS